MAVFSTLRTLVLISALSGASAQVLSPPNDINLPSTSSAKEPLEWLGGNSPWFAGPNLKGISSDVPDGCTVQQAAYVVRHGSRFPDQSAYNGWVSLYQKIQAADFTATGSLAFLKSWKPVLKNTTVQMSQESITGAKEAYDLGYALRARYPDFYADGQEFQVWANQYAFPISSSRVVQTAQNFVRGYMSTFAEQFGNVVSINSTASPLALGNSLGPSDLCPAFSASSTNTTTIWANKYLPPIVTRLNAMLKGNLNFTASDITNFPYLCGFESQITAKVSPWCSVFTDSELQQYEYAQDLSYFYTQGPGSGIPQKMFYPFLTSLLSLLSKGPGQQGKNADGSSFTVPDLIMAFLNDNQLAQMTAAMGLFDDQGMLPADHIPDYWTYIVSHWISMRGTVAFEVLNCSPSASTGTSSTAKGSSSAAGSSTKASSGAGGATPSTSSKGNSGSGLPASSMQQTGVVTVTTTVTEFASCTTSAAKLSGRATSQNQTYVRILLNDAVYPVVSCQDGPGRSCLLSKYADFIAQKSSAAGSFYQTCNVTKSGFPTQVQGASFFTDLSLPYLTNVVP